MKQSLKSQPSLIKEALGISVVSVFALLAIAFLSSASRAETTAPSGIPYKYSPTDKSCGGFPKLPVTTFTGSCLGLVANNEGLRFPRKILELEPQRFLVTDMGGWDPINRGILWELDLRGGKKSLTKRAEGLLIPHDLQFGPDGNIYVGERGRITRFKKSELLASGSVKGEMVLGDVLKPVEGKPHLHPLMKFTFGKTADDLWDLYINMGAMTDACTKEAPKTCTAGEYSAQIRKYKYNPTTNSWDKTGVVWAKGLRNSVGLVTHSTGTIVQAENARALGTSEEPFDELNIIRPNRHYGWPYCFDFAGASPEWKNMRCDRDYAMPFVLLPPHSAPLDLLYYKGTMFPKLQGALLMTWHGYEATGSRVVAYPTDERGMPVLSATKTWSYNEYLPDGITSKVATPRGGELRAAPYAEIISVWNKRSGVRPSGAPVGMTVASDGSIFIVEDKNKSIVILTKSDDPVYRDHPGTDPAEEARVKAGMAKMIATPELQQLFSHLNTNVFQPVCAACHSGIKGTEAKALEFLIRERFVIPGDSTSPMLERVTSKDSARRMPLGGTLSDSEQKQINQWITEAK